MKLYLSLLTSCCAVLITLTGCASDGRSDRPAKSRAELITDLERRVAEEPGGAALDSLLTYYQEDLRDTSLSNGLRFDRARYLAETAYARGDARAAYTQLLDAIGEYPKAPTRPQAALKLADIAINKLDEPHTAELIFATLREQYPGHPALASIPAAYDEISVDALQMQMQREVYPAGAFDAQGALRYGQASLAYTALERDADRALKDHLASGTILEDAGRISLALDHYRRAQLRFAGHDKAGTAMFMEGFVLMEMSGDTVGGKAKIREFLGSYPAHALAKDARRMLE